MSKKRKILTLLLTAALVVGTAASFSGCNNIPFLNQNSTAASEVSTETSAASEASKEDTTESKSEESEDTSQESQTTESSQETIESTVASETSEVSEISETTSTTESQTESQTSESGNNEVSFDISMVSIPEISIPDIGIGSDPVSKPESSTVVVPHGTVNASYAGLYKVEFSLEEMGFTKEEIAELDASTLEEIKKEMSEVTFNIKLNADGTAFVEYYSVEESGDNSQGTWVADGNTVYITIDGDAEEFTYSNNTLTSKTLGMTFKKA